jgi:hypothetical protein
MKMRVPFLTIVLLCSGFAVPQAMAYENYIPLGTGYSPNVNSLPEFSSDAGQVSQQSDVYETELYMRGRKQVEDDSRFRQFFSDSESTGADTHIDY